MDVRTPGRQLDRDAKEAVDALDRHESRDQGDQLGVARNAELATQQIATRAALGAADDERAQVEAERHDSETSGVPHAQADKLVTDLVADGDERVGARR